MTRRKAPLGRRHNRSLTNERSKSLAEARRLFAQARIVLSAYPGVVGVGVGFKERGGISTGRPAFIVTVRSKGTHPPGEALPPNLFDIPVDVQVQAEHPKLKTVAGGQLTQQPGLPPPGRLGCLVQGTTGQIYGLTAMHVLVLEHALEVFRWSSGPFFDVAVDQGSGLGIVGKLRAGEFTNHSDIACIELANGTAWQRGLAGLGTVLTSPADPGSVPLNAGIALVPSGSAIAGVVSQYPYAGDFRTDAGVLPFNELMVFRIATPHGIPDGWSGSVLYDTATRSPMALLSFGTNVSDANGLATAYGFPLFAFYAAWNLRPV